MTPIERIWKVGKLILTKVVYSYDQPFHPDYYKAAVLDELRRWFDLRWENVPGGDNTGEMWYAVYATIDGGYIGSPEDAYRLVQKGLSHIQKAHPSDNVCSIGFHSEKQKWYGWSHRTMYGFGIGDVVKKGDCCASSGYTEEYLREHPEEDESLPVGFKAKKMDDAKRMAVAFADSVS